MSEEKLDTDHELARKAVIDLLLRFVAADEQQLHAK